MATVTLCAACDHICELVGCDSGLTVYLEGQLPDSLAIEIVNDNQAPPAQHFTNVKEYGAVAAYWNYLPDLVTIRVSWATASVEATAKPEYSNYRPNGPDCPPECRVAAVYIDMDRLRRRVLPMATQRSIRSRGV